MELTGKTMTQSRINNSRTCYTCSCVAAVPLKLLDQVTRWAVNWLNEYRYISFDTKVILKANRREEKLKGAEEFILAFTCSHPDLDDKEKFFIEGFRQRIQNMRGSTY